MKLRITIVIIILIITHAPDTWSQPSWSVNSRRYEFSMNVTGVILMNGEESINTGNVVGAFVGNDCRGSGNVAYVPAINRYVVFLTVYGNSEDDLIQFKVYWKEGDKIYNVAKTTNFEINGVTGSPEQPYKWKIENLPDEGETSYLKGCIDSVYEISSEPGSLEYEWSTGDISRSITVDEPGTYSCIRKVNDTTHIIDYWIVELGENPNVSLGQDTAICPGDALILNAQNSGSSYSWSNGETSQTITIYSSGNYSVTVTNSYGCTSTDDIMVHEKPDCITNFELTGCEGDTVIIDATTENASAYRWDSGKETGVVETTTGGNKSVEIKLEDGTLIYKKFHVSLNSLPEVNIADSIFSCTGKEVTLDATSEGCSYLWSTDETSSVITIDRSGSYSVNVKNNTSGCKTKKKIYVEFISPVDYSFNKDIEETCADDLIELDPNVENMKYSWSTGDTTQSIIPQETGLYSLTITNRGGCESSDQIYVIINKNEIHFQDKIIFEGETYQFYNEEINQPGIYTYIDSTYDCPQKVILNLNVINKFEDYGKLTGSVQYDKTNQLGGILLFLKSPGEKISLATQTESNGNFTFNNVPAGNYYLSAMVNHLDLSGNPEDCYYKDASFWNDATLIQINEGESTYAYLDLKSGADIQHDNNDLNSLHAVTGKLIFSDESNNDGIYIDTTQASSYTGINETTRIALFGLDAGSYTFFNSVLTNQNGEYLFQNIPPGDYLIVVDIPGVSQKDSVILHLSESGSFESVNFKIYNGVSVSTPKKEWGEPLKIFPNPCTDFIRIENLNNQEGTVKIYDLYGRCLFVDDVTNEFKFLDIKSLSPGVYIFSFENQTIQNQKFVVH